ncbi:Acyl-coenzyme A synthetase ACSM3, mitochondrial [Exophiala dermatitidis]|uniref:medium-chain acyl-CoA ligase n=1 Tax=Exophiala dermatitidis (strain ATCC 34100 / CBS 525.76 / NIH/UT8656) TaxID=858893 RepID=H6CBI8_EXODN|nr:acetyl-CoA synthetase [Exophiala dermatitidis NIH/UT8656]EHY61135.1 acetyl-CoA synthetase [Exophiala dermatitidis NIH/UT8656]
MTTTNKSSSSHDDAVASVPVSPLRRPESFNFARDVVDYWAAKDASQVALYWTDQHLTTSKQFTYRHFSERSHRVATLLQSLGLKQGDIVIIIAPRVPEWWEIATACLRAGIVLCPCTTLLVDKDIEYRLQVSDAAAFIGDETSVAKCLKVKDKCPKLRVIVQLEDNNKPLAKGVVGYHGELAKVPANSMVDVPSTLKATSPALIFFTSGTTGPPKMVLHTQTSYPLAHALTGMHWLQLSRGKVYWNLSEQGWAKAAWSFFSSWNCGATLFVHDDRLTFNPRRTLEVLHKFPITTLCAPPTVYRQLVLDESRRFFASPEGRPRALVHCCGAGEPLNESVIRVWKDMTGGIEIFDGYGQTETVVVCANQKQNPVKPGSMGKPLPGVPLTVIDPDGNVTKDDEEGDIAIAVSDDKESSFFGIFEGYIDKKTGKLDNKIRRFANGRKYFITGDRASRDKDGYFWFVGRSDDVINSSGYRIGPFEVESTLKLHPAVVESAVVASPDPQRDEVVKAFVVLTDAAASKVASSSQVHDALIKELQEFCKENAAPYKYPRKIEFVPASFLPKTISGKIKRAELKQLERKRYRESQGAKL